MPAHLDHPTTADVRVVARDRRIARVIASLVLALGLLITGTLPSLAAGPNQAERVVRAVSSHIGARYVHGATGPRTFDCSGLVFRAYQEAGLAKRIGGFDTAHGYFQHFRRLGRMGRVAPRVGDLVVYANGGHVGIYVGRGKVVSALLSGVKRHPMRGLNIPFTGILRVSLNRQRPRVTPVHAHRVAQRQVVVADRRLPLRANPGAGSRTLGVIPRGSRMAVHGTRTRWGTTWIRVRRDGHYGWVNEGMTSGR